MKRWMIGILCAGCVLTGCAKENVPAENENKETAPETSSWQYDAEKTVAPARKSELVTVSADAEGKPYQIRDRVELSGFGTEDTIRDVTTLANIRNRQGEEEFEEKDGFLYWENLGENIVYEGDGRNDLPVTVTFSYYLNGQKTTPEKIRGKRGHVKIEIEAVNHTGEPERVRGQEKNVPVPFAAVTALFLPEDVFRNVEVENGELTSLSSESAVVGVLFPGMQDVLKIGDETEERFPSRIIVEADTDDFRLGFSTTLISNGLFEKIGEDDLKDADEMIDGIRELSKAAGSLSDAVGKLQEGEGKLKDGLHAYFEGESQLNDGIGALYEGIKELDQNKSALRDGVDQLDDTLQEIRKLAEEFEIPEEEKEQLKAAVSDLEKKFERLKEDTGEYQDLMQDSEALKSQLNQAAKTSAKQAALEVLKDNENLSEEEKEQIAESIYEKTDLTDVLPDFSAYASEIEELNTAINTLIASLPEEVKNLTTDELLEKIDTFSSGFDTYLDNIHKLREGMDQFAEGIGTLKDGAYELKKGSSALTEQNKTIEEGMKTLYDGLGEYRKGMETFRNEGISELENFAEEDVGDLLEEIRVLRKKDGAYRSYSGVMDGCEGEVTFLIETDEIE